KQKLQNEGLFDLSRKRMLPVFPKRIALLTSPTGAAVQDFIKVSKDQFPARQILIYPVEVQGEKAASEIAKGIEFINAEKERLGIDLIVIVRGGGSIEDLWAFNEEVLVRAIAASALPVLTGIGHETDYTLSDMAADCSASTPSKAAQMVYPHAKKELENLAHLYERLKAAILRTFENLHFRLSAAASSRALTDRLTNIRILDQRVDELYLRLTSSFNTFLNEKEADFKRLASLLNTLSPLSILSRGYSVVKDFSGSIIGSVKKLKQGMEIEIKMADGTARADVRSIMPAIKREDEEKRVE
ncbi:MAG: exodeoxyribonuclease VII large subunit, partial [Thermoplasmata archaeon]